MIRPFTGWHMTGIFIAFFGVVIAVNLVMARYAVGTFGGTVVDNSYVASQSFNRWLDEANKQEKLGWTPIIAINDARQVVISVSLNGVPLTDLTAAGLAVHPLGRAPSVPLVFEKSGSGQLQTRQALPEGRWLVQLTLRRGADVVNLDMPVP